MTVPNKNFHTAKNSEFHISKAERNEDFYASVNKSTFDEWSAVVMFYIAVHYVDAVLSQDSSLNAELRDPENHFTRNEALSKCSTIAEIMPLYLNLYNRSRDARYRMISFPSWYLPNLHTVAFKPLYEHLRKVLGLKRVH